MCNEFCISLQTSWLLLLLQCKILSFIDSTVINSGCSNGDLRLSDGLSKYEGRVEICTNGVWGSICNSGWGYDEAYAVCKQLGFQGIIIILKWILIFVISC